MKEKTKIKRNSTVAISAIDTERLDRFCRAHDITKKDFITLSLSYFEREGINPKSHESPKSEIEKVIKRLDHFFAFFKKQEQEFIRPLVLDFAESKNRQEKHFKNVLDNQVKFDARMKKEHQNIKDVLDNTIVHEVKSNNESRSQYYDMHVKDRSKQQEELKKALQVLAQHMDEKNKSGLLNKLFK